MEYNVKDEDLRRIFPDVAVIPYNQLSSYSYLDQLLGRRGMAIILYLSDDHYGHWTCVFRRRDNPSVVEFFDSYGRKVDGELPIIPIDVREHLNEVDPILGRLMMESGYELKSNQYDFQAYKGEVDTCGRWVITRLWSAHLSDSEFRHAVLKICANNGWTPDEFVCKATKDAVGK